MSILATLLLSGLTFINCRKFKMKESTNKSDFINTKSSCVVYRLDYFSGLYRFEVFELPDIDSRDCINFSDGPLMYEGIQKIFIKKGDKYLETEVLHGDSVIKETKRKELICLVVGLKTILRSTIELRTQLANLSDDGMTNLNFRAAAAILYGYAAIYNFNGTDRDEYFDFMKQFIINKILISIYKQNERSSLIQEIEDTTPENFYFMSDELVKKLVKFLNYSDMYLIFSDTDIKMLLKFD